MNQKHRTTEIRQGQITEAAQKIIVKYGSEHVTVRRIAKEVGFSEGAIYRHFKSKKDILSLLIGNIEENLLGDIALSDVSEHTPLHVLENILRSHLSSIRRREGISFLVMAEIISLGDRELNRRVSKTIEKYMARLKDLLNRGVDAGEVREDIDLDGAAFMLFGMIQGLVNIWALSNRSFDPEQKYASLWPIFREAVVRR